MSIDLDNNTIMKILGSTKRFCIPNSENNPYYISDDELTDNMTADIIRSLYYEKLRYAVNNADILIKQVFQPDFFEFYGVDKRYVGSPAEMCAKLYFDSFVFYPKKNNIGACLSNNYFMFGHFIDAEWDKDWNLLSVWID